MRHRAGGIVLIALSAAAFAALAGDAQNVPSHASADDCAVIAEAGKAQLKWGEKPLDTHMSPLSYGIDCNWQSLGLAPPVMSAVTASPYYPDLRFSFAPPSYSADRLTATVKVGLSGNAGPSSYFGAGYICTVEKRNGRWQPAACKMQFIT